MDTSNPRTTLDRFLYRLSQFHPGNYHDGGETREELAVYELGGATNYAGGSNLLYIPSDTYHTLITLFNAVKRGENEEITDAATRLIGIPMNLTSAAGTIVGYGIGFEILPKSALIMNPITMIAGLFLCIVEGIVDAVSLKRQNDFEHQFDFEFLSCLRKMIDYKDEKSARKTTFKINRLLAKNPQLLNRLVGKEQESIVKEVMETIEQHLSQSPHLTPTILNHFTPALEEISRQALIPNLRKLRDEYLIVHAGEILEISEKLDHTALEEKQFVHEMLAELETVSIMKKKKLARRIRPWMVDEASKTIDPLLTGIVNKDSEAIQEGLRLIDDIHVQSKKKMMIHILGLIALTFAALSLIAMGVVMPVIIPYIVAAVAMTVSLVRAGMFAGSLDSRGWSFEPQKILPECLRKRIFENTPPYPEIKHHYQKAIPSYEKRTEYPYTKQLDLSKQGFTEMKSRLPPNAHFPQHTLYV